MCRGTSFGLPSAPTSHVRCSVEPWFTRSLPGWRTPAASHAPGQKQEQGVCLVWKRVSTADAETPSLRLEETSFWKSEEP